MSGYVNVKFDLDEFKNEDFEAGREAMKKEVLELIDELNDVLCNYTPNGSSAGIEEELIRDLLIYPNPTSGIVKIKAEDGAQGKIIISNLVGECIKSFEVNSSEFSIDLNSFPAGSYVVTFNTINGESTSRLVQKY